MIKLNETQRENAVLIYETAKPFIPCHQMRVAMICVAFKECGLIPCCERSYKNTANSRIKKIFGRRKLGKYYDDSNALSILKKNDIDFFRLIYGGIFGNDMLFDGWNYRARGFNGLTFKNNYYAYSTSEHDLVIHPNLANDPHVAAKIFTDFFSRVIKNNMDLISKRYGILYDECDKNHLYKTIRLAANINAGIRKSPESTVVRTAYENALPYYDFFEDLILWGDK